MNRYYLIVLGLLIFDTSVKAQKWLPGHFTDVKSNVVTGFIRINPAGKSPVSDEGFIEFKDDDKTNPYKLSASELKSVVVGKDSFVVAHAPGNESWAKHELDFVKVAIDEDLKLYVAGGGGTGRSGGHGLSFSPGLSTGIGTGGFGSGVGAGISVPIGGSGNRNNDYEKTSWYYGPNTAEMRRLTEDNFEDILTDIMGDYPEVVEKIHAKVYVLANIDRLIAYYKKVKSEKK